MSLPTRIVCLGGGFVGNFLAKTLRRAIKKKIVELTVIDRNNYRKFHGLFPAMIAGKVHPSSIAPPSRDILAPAQFYNAEIETVDWINKSVTVSRALDGRQFHIPYDHLVIGLGFDDNLKRYPGFYENAFRVRRFGDAFLLKNHIPQMLEFAEIEKNQEERARLLTFVVVGGNYAGVEIAAELANLLKCLIQRTYTSISKDEIRIILVHSGKQILPELGERFPRLALYAKQLLSEALGIKIKFETRIISATPSGALTDKEEFIATRTIVSAIGSASNALFDEWNFERDAHGRIKTDATLNVVGQSSIWAGGDCAAIPHSKKGFSPSLAPYAMNAGVVIGKNILRQLKHKPLRSFIYNSWSDICILGRYKAVGNIMGIPVKGFFPWFLGRLTQVKFNSGRRVRLLTDWIVNALAGPDITSIQMQQTLSIAQKFYDAGQTIINEGDIGNAMFFIQKGEVKIFQTSREHEILATLAAGDHFGEIAVFNKCRRTANVVAITPVTVLEIKREAAEALSMIFSEIKYTPFAEKKQKRSV